MKSKRIFLETSCQQCLIEVFAWGEHGGREVTVTVMSEHLPLERWLWRGRNGRLRTAWRVLRRGWIDSQLDFHQPEELYAFLEALVKANAVAFDNSHVGLLHTMVNNA